MLYTNVDIEGRLMEYYVGDRKNSSHTVEIGAMRVCSCLTPIKKGFHEINFSEDGHFYVVDYGSNPLWLLLAAADPKRMKNDDEEGITTRQGGIRYLLGSTFFVEDYAYGPNRETRGLDVVLLRLEAYDEAVFEVEYDNGDDTEFWYYIVKNRQVYRVQEYADVAIIGKSIGLGDELMEMVYPRRPNVMEEDDVFDEFTFLR